MIYYRLEGAAWLMFLVNWVSAVAICVDITLSFCLIVYALRLRKIFKGGSIGRSTPYLVGSAVFFFLSSIARSTTIFEVFTSVFDPVSLLLRAIAFLLLFAFLIRFVEDWKTFGTKKNGGTK